MVADFLPKDAQCNTVHTCWSWFARLPGHMDIVDELESSALPTVMPVPGVRVNMRPASACRAPVRAKPVPTAPTRTAQKPRAVAKTMLKRKPASGHRPILSTPKKVQKAFGFVKAFVDAARSVSVERPWKERLVLCTVESFRNDSCHARVVHSSSHSLPGGSAVLRVFRVPNC